MLRAQFSRKFELLTQSGARGTSANRKQDFSANFGNSGLKLDVMANPSSIITQVSSDEEANQTAREKGEFGFTLRDASRLFCRNFRSWRSGGSLFQCSNVTLLQCYNVIMLHCYNVTLLH